MKERIIRKSILNFLISVALNVSYVVYLQIRFGADERGILVAFVAIVLYITLAISGGAAIAKDKNSYNIPGLIRGSWYLELFQFMCLGIVLLLYLFGELISQVAFGLGNVISIIAINLIGLVFLFFCPMTVVNTLTTFIRMTDRNADFTDKLA